MRHALPDQLLPDAALGDATLRVRDLGRALRFYTEIIGLEPFDATPSSALLGARAPFLRLEGDPEALLSPVYSTGLYHLAILLPSRRALAEAVMRLAQARYPVQGAADHGVSEAYYLADPDGNGLELYRDRPRSVWRYQGGQLLMGVDPLDESALMAMVQQGEVPAKVPPETRLGHLHFKVHRLEVAEAFYGGVLGFEVTARLPGALFMAAGGYHHHLGFNTWQSAGAPRPPEQAVGLRRFSILVPSSGFAPLLARLERQGVAHEVAHRREGEVVTLEDPWGRVLELRPV